MGTCIMFYLRLICYCLCSFCEGSCLVFFWFGDFVHNFPDFVLSFGFFDPLSVVSDIVSSDAVGDSVSQFFVPLVQQLFLSRCFLSKMVHFSQSNLCGVVWGALTFFLLLQHIVPQSLTQMFSVGCKVFIDRVWLKNLFKLQIKITSHFNK